MTHGAEGEGAAQPGQEQVDGALQRLGELDELPAADHVEVFEDLHDRLRRVLDGLDGS